MRLAVHLAVSLALVTLTHFPTPAMAAAPAPVANRESQALARLCRDYWEGHLRANPTAATAIGDRRYDDRLPDISPPAIAAERRRLEWVAARARALPVDSLDRDDRITRGALIEETDGRLGVLACHFERWNVDPLDGPQVDFLNLPDYTAIATPRDGERYVLRVRAMGPFVDRHVANLRAGLAAHEVASVFGVRKVLDQLHALEREAPRDWPLMAPAATPRTGFSEYDRKRFHDRLEAAIGTVVAPAFRRYREFLERDVLPVARPEDKAGMSELPGGLESYQRLIRVHTSLDRTPEQLHQLGLDEVKRIRGELSVLGKKVLGTGNIAEIQRRLRTDPAMHFRTAQEVETKARTTLARAKAAIPRWFGRLPKAPCEVKVIGMHEAPQSTIAYYRQPSQDGSRPGAYMINTYQPKTRPRYEAEVLAFHESIPGHHLQIAIAQELEGLPAFRKHEGVTAFVEGWGLYSERLASDMGLYSGDVDRIGMLSFDAWRACRLVVDTGIHAMGWSRQRAIDYMVANSVLAENNIVNEVDRYIANPGQALAYKCGQLEFLSLRAEAKRRLGDRFDIKRFHDVVLENGAVALPVLREQVEAWIAERANH